MGVPRNVFFLGLVSMFNDFSSEMTQSVMPLFLTTVLGAPVMAVGLIEGFADALASILKIVFGWLSDKWNRRKSFAVFGYLLSVSTRPFLILATSYGHVFGLRALDRVGKGMRDAPRDALIAESTTPETLGRSFGYHRMMDTIGGTLGPLAAFFILPLVFFSYNFIFVIAFVVGTLSVVTFLLVKEKKRPDDGMEYRFDFNLVKSNRRFVVFLASVFVFGLGTLPLPLILLRAPEVGFVAVSVPFFYFVTNCAFVLASAPFGRLGDTFGKRKMVSIGFAAALAAHLLLIFAHSFIAFFASFALLGIYSAATDGIQRAMVARLVDPKIRATGQGFLNASTGISALLAGGIGGALWTYIGAQAAFVYAATMSFAGLVLFLILMHVRFRE